MGIVRRELKKAVKKPVKRTKETIPVIKDEEGYNSTMGKIEMLIKAGNGTIRSKDLTLYSRLAKAAAEFEQSIYTIPSPKTLEGLLEWKMYELKLKQNGLAKRLHVSDAKLSLVMSGKQKPDAGLLKSIHTELGIDGNVLLSVL